MTQYYNLYCNDIISCKFCGSVSNLYYIKLHLNKSKRCKDIQKQLKQINENNFNLTLIDFNLEINKLKNKIRKTE